MNGLLIDDLKDRAVAWSDYQASFRDRAVAWSDYQEILKEKQSRRLVGLLISVLKERAVAWAEYQSIEKGILTLMDVKDQSKMVG